MVILYLALKHDPRDPDAASGSDFNYHQALLREGFDVHVVGPFKQSPHILERGLRRLYCALTRKSFIKFHFSLCLRASRTVDRTVESLKPDAIFTIFPAAVSFLRTKVPLIVRLDTTFLGQEASWPLYGRLALKICVWQERRAFERSSFIVTQSEWSKNVLESRYGVESAKIAVFPNPAALPSTVIPSSIEAQTTKRLGSPIELLFVGREIARKGLSTALELVEELKALGISAHLTICGLDGPSTSAIRYVGVLRKGVPEELNAYLNLYRVAHLLVHPALFEAAGIVPSEAAAFATPTITNDTGGLATTVKDGVSGVVLPRGSSALTYAKCIADLVSEPERYYRLCQTTRERYEAELNWEVAGQRVAAVVREAVAGARRS